MDHSQSLDLPLLSKPIRNDAHYIYYNNIAIFISTISFFYNIIEGAVSIYFGEVTDSLSLFFFGVQSIVEVLSSIIVLWKVMTSYTEDKNQIRKEKIATVFIGCLFIFLTIGIFITGILSLINHDYPTTTIPNIIVSSCATSIMLCLYFTKVKLAKELNSSTIQSDAQCSLACIRITVLLLLGSIVFHFWEGGWWIDGAIALILGVLFGKEGVSMLIWANSKDFSGGCCGGCAKMPESSKPALTKVRCTTSLENADQDIEAKVPLKQGASGGCCKAGKCSKKEENPQSISNPQASLSTAIISNGIEDTTLKTDSVLPQKAGGCCKSGVCSKKAQPAPVEANLSSAPKDFVSNENKIEVIEDKPMPIKAAGGGCCKSGTCSKKAEVAQAQPQSAQIIVDVPIINEANGQSDSIRPEEPQKKTGGCCKGGKCSKKVENPESVPSENIPQAIVKEVDLAQNIINEQPSSEPAVLPIKAGGGCCKGGKCNKKEESLPTISTLADTSVATSSNIESEVIVVPQKTGGCCKNGVCTKKAQANVPEVSEASQASASSQDIQIPVTTSEDKVDIVVPSAGKGGCCKNGVCSKKANNGQQNTGLNNNEEEIRLRTQGESYSQEVVKEDIC